VCVIVLCIAAPAQALEIQLKEVATAAETVRASIELRDVVPDRFRKMLEDNVVLHLRVQAELWESRPVWDRLVYPAIVRVIQMTRETVTHPAPPVSMIVELGNRDRIVASSRYYVHVVATLGTLAEREAEEVGDAVFGRESETNTLGSLGRVIFRTAIKINDYLQSVSAEIKSRKMPGSDVLRLAQ